MSGFFRRIFGGSESSKVEQTTRPVLEREELERIGTDEDLLRDYDRAAERNFRAMEAEQRGDTSLARQLYQESIEEDFVEAHPYERLAELHDRNGDYQAALEVTERFIRLTKSGRLPKGAQLSANRRLQGFEQRAARYRERSGE